MTAHQSERAAPLAGCAAPSKLLASHSRNTNPTPDDEALTALRRQFACLGMSVYRILGDELAVTGAGLSRSIPDDRCAWVLLRHLKGGMA